MTIEEYSRIRTEQEQNEKLARCRILNQMAIKGQILFTGSSLMEQFPINELLMNCGMAQVIYNRGIGGFRTEDMLKHMEEMVFGTEPSRIFINIGTNDIAQPDYRLEKLLENYEKILKRIFVRLPEAEVTVMAYYPVNDRAKVKDEGMRQQMFGTRNNENIRLANEAVKGMAERLGCRFVDANRGLTDEEGRLREEFTVEGIHMYANGYQTVLENLREYL